MVLYRCSKCGREVEMPEGDYVCKICLTPLEVTVGAWGIFPKIDKFDGYFARSIHLIAEIDKRQMYLQWYMDKIVRQKEKKITPDYMSYYEKEVDSIKSRLDSLEEFGLISKSILDGARKNLSEADKEYRKALAEDDVEAQSRGNLYMDGVGAWLETRAAMDLEKKIHALAREPGAHASNPKEMRCIEDDSRRGKNLATDLNKILNVTVKVCKSFYYNGFDATEFFGGVYQPDSRTVLIGPKASVSTIIHEKIHADQHRRLGDEFKRISEEIPRPEAYWELEREARRLVEAEDPIVKSKINAALNKYHA